MVCLRNICVNTLHKGDDDDDDDDDDNNTNNNNIHKQRLKLKNLILLVLLGCKTGSFTLREQRELRVIFVRI